MLMNNKLMHRAFGLMAFIVALVTYMMTVQPSVPFWDCGEFSAASMWQQVPHPPGAPLFLMLGKFFQTIIPFGDDGWKINLVSVFASAFTIFLLYLITVMAIENFRKEKIESLGDSLAVYGSAFIAAAAFTFSDTFWFNAVESEVYASSSLFVAVVVYLMMKWNEKADEPGHEKYLMLIAYLIGLSTGVHLLSILTVFSIVFVVYIRKYKITFGSFLIMSAIAVLIFFVIYPGIVKWLPALLAGHSPSRNEAREYAIENSTALTAFTLAIIGLIGYGFFWAHKKGNSVVKLVTSSLLLILLGYTTYTQILIRSNANPPMNENTPKNFALLTSYLGREQYGDAPSWPRRYQTEDYFVQEYQRMDRNGNYIYGPWNPPGRRPVERSDGSTISLPDFDQVNTSGEIAYLWKYQIDHMYFRYLFWNFVGRMSDVQDAQEAWFAVDKAELEQNNYKSGYADQFPVRFFALPLLFGLIGLFYYGKKDPKMALAFFAMFLLMGLLAAIQQNQQNPQPRERDYFYAGSFMVFSMWIGLGVYALIDWFGKKKMTVAIVVPILAVSTLMVPFNMAAGGWKIHSRAGNYIPFDYSYNILQSVEKDAILFTNGDNDTFPVWYLQDVEGIRRDVRVVNLSLGNTLWYVDQLKNRSPWGAEKIPLSFSDDSLRVDEVDSKALSYDFGETMQVAIPVDRDILSKYTNDPAVLADGNMRFAFAGKPYQQSEGKMINLIRVQDKLVLDILRQTRFKRPVYFSNTVGPDAFCGLEGHFRYEGMAMRICPVPQKSENGEVLDENIMEQCLMNVDNTDNYAKEPKYGFKFRNLNNPSVYYDEVHRRLMNTYRRLFLMYAEYSLKTKHNPAKAIAIADKMNELISVTQFPMSFDQEFSLAKLYDAAGAVEQTRKTAEMGIKSCLEIIESPTLRPEMAVYEASGRYIGPHRYAAQMYEMTGNYKGAKSVLERLLAQSKAMLSQTTGEEAGRINSNIYDVKVSIEELAVNELLRAGKTKEALAKANEIYSRMQSSSDQGEVMFSELVRRKIVEIEKQLGVVKDTASVLQASAK